MDLQENGYTKSAIPGGSGLQNANRVQRDVEGIGPILIETDKYTGEIAAMARELADCLGGGIPEAKNSGASPTGSDVRSVLIEHRAKLAWIGEELRRAIRSLKG